MSKKINGLPVYKMKPGLGVDFHSLVSDPAIEVLFKTFNNDKRWKFNQEEQIITGPFMIPDMPIYRSDMSHGEYYVVFEKETVKEMNEMFMTARKTLSFNYQHMDNSQISDAVLVENWIVKEGDNKAKALGFDVPVGTWMGSVKINNKKFWDEEIKSGNVKGFSIEGYLDMEMKKHTKMTKKTFKVTAKTKDGSYTLATEADAWAVNVEVFTVAEDGTQAPAADGDYMLEDGTVIKVLSGKVTEVVPSEDELTEEEAETIMKSIAPKVQKAIDAIVAPLKAEIATLKETLSKLPGGKSQTDPDDEEEERKRKAKQKNHAQSVREKLNFLTTPKA